MQHNKFVVIVAIFLIKSGHRISTKGSITWGVSRGTL